MNEKCPACDGTGLVKPLVPVSKGKYESVEAMQADLGLRPGTAEWMQEKAAREAETWGDSRGLGNINITDGVPSEIHVAIGRGRYDDEPGELALDMLEAVRDGIADAIRAIPMESDALVAALLGERRVTLHVAGYPKDDDRPLDSLVSEALAQRDNRIAALEAERDRLRTELAAEKAACLERARGETARLDEWIAERDRLRAALASVAALADDELRRLGAVPGSNVAQIEADALAALAPEDRRD